jgi:ferredoxin-NADP reductase/predicted pyridoxine 5'-phosphate oxidase superfamily flavin-nucleotide-binding protein
MPKKFAEITFTQSVKSAQARYGSRDVNKRFELAEDPGDTLGPAEIAFIEERDSFYQATTNEDGWPYVQHRGGPPGFLKVLDEQTIGYADFRGNIQYLSVGNLSDNDRISMILMDYPNRRRLKIWARARLVHDDEDPDLIARLEVPTYRARVERGVVLTIEAIEWNCPQHITPRFTETDIDDVVTPLLGRIAELEATTVAQPDAAPVSPSIIGDGPLELVITGIRQLTPEVRAYELRRPDFKELPVVSAGSHIQVPVVLGNGSKETRTFSISSNPNRRDIYEIAVRLDPQGRGGTRSIHDHYALGLTIQASLPKNGFCLHESSQPAILIAGGIGITPLKAMAQTLQTEGRKFHLHFAARSLSLMAYRSKLALALDGSVSFYPGNEGQKIDLKALLSSSPKDAVFYVCGPERLTKAVRETADALGIDSKHVRFENFTAATPEAGDTAFQVRLKQTGTELSVAQDVTILDALLDAGIAADFGCKSGTCGACAVKVLEGTPVHRDSTLSDAERDQAGLICPCISRAGTDGLTLDL